MTDAASDPTGAAAASPLIAVPPVNITALFGEAASKSALMWVDVPGDRAWPFWHAWAQDTVYAVTGPGEQSLPELPDRVVLIARSKDTGGRLLSVHATVDVITPRDPAWGPATEALKAARLNATDDVVARWAAGCTVLALHPYGTPVEAPGHYGAASGARPVPPSSATTAGWRPWHWRGRPRRRRGNRLPDEG